MSITNIMDIASDKSKALLVDLKDSFRAINSSRINQAFVLGYEQAVQEFKDRTFTPKEYKITYQDFNSDIENPGVIEKGPIYNADFDVAMAMLKDLKKRKMINVELDFVDTKNEPR